MDKKWFELPETGEKFFGESDRVREYFLRSRASMKFKATNLAHKPQTSLSMGRELRTVGQGLEALDVGDFDLKAEGDGYFALAIPHQPVTANHAAGNVKKALQSAWLRVTGRRSFDRKLDEGAPGVFRVLFTPQGLLRLERAGRARRSASSAGIPNLKKLAQVLRMVGEHLDARSGRLLKVSKRGNWIAFEYTTVARRHRTEEWKISELYNLWLESSERREERATIVERR